MNIFEKIIQKSLLHSINTENKRYRYFDLSFFTFFSVREKKSRSKKNRKAKVKETQNESLKVKEWKRRYLD